jgi:hypothetical protein
MQGDARLRGGGLPGRAGDRMEQSRAGGALAQQFPGVSCVKCQISSKFCCFALVTEGLRISNECVVRGDFFYGVTL